LIRNDFPIATLLLTSEVAKHAIIQAGEFSDGVTSRQFGFDRTYYSPQSSEDLRDREPCDRRPPQPATR
jgi:hypothetical protein